MSSAAAAILKDCANQVGQSLLDMASESQASTQVSTIFLVCLFGLACCEVVGGTFRRVGGLADCGDPRCSRLDTLLNIIH